MSALGPGEGSDGMSATYLLFWQKIFNIENLEFVVLATYQLSWKFMMDSNLEDLLQDKLDIYLRENYCSSYTWLGNNYSKTLWLKTTVLWYLWILWLRNLEKAHGGQLVSVPQSLGPHLRRLEDWGWHCDGGHKTPTGLLTRTSHGECWLSAGTSAPQLDGWPEYFHGGCLCFPIAWWPDSKGTKRKLCSLHKPASEVTVCHLYHSHEPSQIQLEGR